MNEDEELVLVGTPCPVPNCEGYVKDIAEDDFSVLKCDYGHIMEYEVRKKATKK